MLESGIKKTGLDTLIKTGYNILGLNTFFTLIQRKQELGQLKKIPKQSMQQVLSILTLKKVL